MSPPDRLAEIFRKQRELTLRFHPIEHENRALHGSFDPKVPVDLLSFAGQDTIRGHAWRIVEEVAEAREARVKGTFNSFVEEMADVLHFVVELMILSDVEVVDLADRDASIGDRLTLCYPMRGRPKISEDSAWLEFLDTLGDAIHELRWKAWKQNPVATNVKAYRWKLNDVFFAFCKVCDSAGIGPDLLHMAYFAKHRVNVERINAAR